MHVQLSEEDFQHLLRALGMALYVAINQQDRPLMAQILRLSNEVNKNNPNWTPYEVPNEHVNVTGAGFGGV